MTMKRLLPFFCVLACAMLHAGLTVTEQDGTFSILRDGKPLVDAIGLRMPQALSPDYKRSFVQLKDGGKAWNVWCEDPKCINSL